LFNQLVSLDDDSPKSLGERSHTGRTSLSEVMQTHSAHATQGSWSLEQWPTHILTT
jgi:hypothetical protein